MKERVFAIEGSGTPLGYARSAPAAPVSAPARMTPHVGGDEVAARADNSARLQSRQESVSRMYSEADGRNPRLKNAPAGNPSNQSEPKKVVVTESAPARILSPVMDVPWYVHAPRDAESEQFDIESQESRPANTNLAARAGIEQFDIVGTDLPPVEQHLEAVSSSVSSSLSSSVISPADSTSTLYLPRVHSDSTIDVTLAVAHAPFDDTISQLEEPNLTGAIAASESTVTSNEILQGDLSQATVRTLDSRAGAVRYPFKADAGHIQPLDKSKLGITQFAEKIERAALIDAVSTHALMQPLIDIAPSENSDFAQHIQNLISGIEAYQASLRSDTDDDGRPRSLDIEDPNRDVTNLIDFKTQVQESYSKFEESAAKLIDAKAEFMNYKRRQAGGKATMADSLQRNLFGNEKSAVLLRSFLQSLVVVGVSAGIQRLTTMAISSHLNAHPEKVPQALIEDARKVLGDSATDNDVLQQVISDLAAPGSSYLDETTNAEAVEAYFNAHPEKVPQALIDEARKELGDTLTDNDVLQKVISDLAAPGSTYLDENTNTAAAIYATEAVVGGIRGVILPVADSANEADARAARVQDTINNSRNPAEPLSRGQRAVKAMRNAMWMQFKANIGSGAIAAGVSVSTTGTTTGPKVMIEVSKTAGFSLLAAAINIMADGVRAAVYTGKSEAISQAVKASARVLGRVAAQGVKTGISIGQSAAAGQIDTRSAAVDGIKAAMQSVVSGTAKEALGAASQYATNRFLPPNERAVVQMGDTLASAAKLAVALNVLETSDDLNDSQKESITALSSILSRTFTAVQDANTTKFESLDFDDQYVNYMIELDPEARRPSAT